MKNCQHMLKDVETMPDGSIVCHACNTTIRPAGTEKYYTPAEFKKLLEQASKFNKLLNNLK